MEESENERRARIRRGRTAGRVLLACLAAFDVVFVLGAMTHPTWWRFAILAVLIAPQVHYALGLRSGQPDDQTTRRSRVESTTRSTATRGCGTTGRLDSSE